MATSVLYAIARSKAIENKGLTAERLTRLLDCNKLGEMQKILLEMGYEGNDCFFMIENERNRVFEFLLEVSPDDNATDCFLLKNEYHNAKALVKSKYLHQELDEKILIKNTITDILKLKEYILTDNYSYLSSYLSDALESIDKAFVKGERDSKVIESHLTKSMYQEILSKLKTQALSGIKQYFIDEINTINILTALRVKNYNLGENVFISQYIYGGLDLNYFIKILEAGNENIYDILKFTEYENLAKFALEDIMNGSSFINYEREVDNYMMNKLKVHRYSDNLLTFYGYIVGKFNEIKNVSIIATAIRSAVDKSLVKLRLRDLYV
jgi:V/A-type H+-transporting ATPase subunit C